jgi:ATP-binding cassette subfamily B protein/subfamily B ATP-binding cassette protein MsbA
MKTLRFVFSFTRKYSYALALTMASMILLVGVELLAPWIIRTMIAAVKDQALTSAALAIIPRLALMALLVYVVRGGLQFTKSYMAHIAGWGVVADVRRHIYSHLQRLSLSYFEDKQTGHLMSRTVNDSDLFEKLISHAVPDVSVNILSLVGVSAVLASMNWHLMLLSLIPVPLIILAMRGYAKFVRPAFVKRQHELGELNATLNDNLSGIREIQAFTREDTEARRIGEHINRYRKSLLEALRMMATFHPFIAFSSSLGTVVILYFGGRLALNQILAIEDLVAFFLYLNLFYRPILALSSAWENIQESLAGADRVSELLQEKPRIKESAGAVALPPTVSGGIAFRDVCFRYRRGESVLDGINLHIPGDSVAALVGPTGVGKTTLVSLIPRFYDATEGAITIDGRDVRELTLRSLRQSISVVSQDVFLFHGTVRSNILFGYLDADEQAMVRAARIANAEEFIDELPEGYDTYIGERGVKLSGGQKQRLAIARAVLKDAPILILDEATSSVDVETERLIQEALDRLMVHRTAIVIAHRLSTVRKADLIVVLEGSRIAEMGTHDELMEGNGPYRRMNNAQLGIYS